MVMILPLGEVSHCCQEGLAEARRSPSDFETAAAVFRRSRLSFLDIIASHPRRRQDNRDSGYGIGEISEYRSNTLSEDFRDITLHIM